MQLQRLRPFSGSQASLYRSAPCMRAMRITRRAAQTKEQPHQQQGQEQQKVQPTLDAQKTTEKFGLEAGLFKVLTSETSDPEKGQSRTEQAKQLLAKYGSAYLVTSISFAVVSFACCYAAVSAGVDVRSLLASVGLEVNQTSEAAGTLAIAYAAHKALSPVRFPPTVALTPVVAKWFGQRKDGPESKK